MIFQKPLTLLRLYPVGPIGQVEAQSLSDMPQPRFLCDALLALRISWRPMGRHLPARSRFGAAG